MVGFEDQRVRSRAKHRERLCEAPHRRPPSGTAYVRSGISTGMPDMVPVHHRKPERAVSTINRDSHRAL